MNSFPLWPAIISVLDNAGDIELPADEGNGGCLVASVVSNSL